ncbi:MAG: ABC transporter permease [Clostridia bacterium]|nr:ABC transporter permease [Clostridia bacterium]
MSLVLVKKVGLPALVCAELQKMKRCQMLLVGFIALALCPALQLGTQYVVDESVRNPNFDLLALFDSVIWGNAQVFLPLSFTLIGGYWISREITDDTLKNMLTVPVSFPRMIAGKLLALMLLSVLFGLYSCVMTLLIGGAAGLARPDTGVLIGRCAQNIAICACTCAVTLPIIVLFGRTPGAYLGGAVFAFFCGYSILFFKSGPLRSVYPFLAPFSIVGFDTANFNGAKEPANIVLSALSMLAMLALTAGLTLTSKPPERTSHKAAHGQKTGQRR